jgi:hypothetical protein
MRKFFVSLCVVAAALPSADLANADPSTPFQFEALIGLNDMATYIREHFPLGSLRSDLRRAFVEEGHAKLKTSSNETGVEKYIYDINLCSYYIWRWNVSSDYDSEGKLLQAYVNGNIVFPEGKAKRIIPKVAEEGKKASIFKAQRPRPEASKGETSLGFILFDRDSDLKTTNDQAAIGAGPSRADPVNFGKLTTYIDVDPWRSIFDSDSADQIVPYKGDCVDAGKRMQGTKARDA